MQAPVAERTPLVELAETMETEAELGELLLAVVRSARNRGFDAERALRGAVRQYQNRHPETSAPGS
ncbi:nucleoside triphosphate pyrophosphohydrolase [compost metagenome]